MLPVKFIFILELTEYKDENLFQLNFETESFCNLHFGCYKECENEVLYKNNNLFEFFEDSNAGYFDL